VSATRHHRDTDLDRLKRLRALSWLSASELASLVDALRLSSFRRHELIVRDAALISEAHILLSGIARIITCLKARSERMTVALLAPGLIPELPLSANQPFQFPMRGLQ
jgi:hypothetical protein